MHLFFVGQVSDPDVCQLRLDFAEFHLSGPSLITSPFGHCLHDRMAIFSSRTQNLGLSGGNLLCGDMKGQHSKLFCIDFATELSTQKEQKFACKTASYSKTQEDFYSPNLDKLGTKHLNQHGFQQCLKLTQKSLILHYCERSELLLEIKSMRLMNEAYA